MLNLIINTLLTHIYWIFFFWPYPVGCSTDFHLSSENVNAKDSNEKRLYYSTFTRIFKNIPQKTDLFLLVRKDKCCCKQGHKICIRKIWRISKAEWVDLCVITQGNHRSRQGLQIWIIQLSSAGERSKRNCKTWSHIYFQLLRQTDIILWASLLSKPCLCSIDRAQNQPVTNINFQVIYESQHFSSPSKEWRAVCTRWQRWAATFETSCHCWTWGSTTGF